LQDIYGATYCASHVASPDIDCLEQLVLNSAPARLDVLHDGWLMRTRRTT
jgi:hypothetical protein